MRKTTALLGTGALFAATAGLALPASAQDDGAQLSVLHGVPGLTVDVYVNGSIPDPSLDDFEPGSLAGPLTLPAGTYTVAITASDAAGPDEAVIGPIDLTLESGMNYTAAAHLDETGEAANATATLFTNDTSAAGAGEGKVTVRHIAANAQGVEIVANGETSLGTFDNGGELGPVALPAGTISAEILAEGEPVPPTPADVPVTEGENTIVYAWGDASGGSVEIAVQTVALGHSAPSGVPGGESGLAAASNAGWLYAAAAVGIVGIAVAGRRLATSEK